MRASGTVQSVDSRPLLDQPSVATTQEFESYPSSESWTDAREALIEMIRTKYEFASEAVATHLRRNSEIAWKLLGAETALIDAFRTRVDLSLDLVRDPEHEEAEPELFGYVRSALQLEEALAAVDRFDQAWFIDNLDILAGRLSFDLKF